MNAQTLPAFQRSLAGMLPVARAQAVFPYIEQLPIGAQLGPYTRVSATCWTFAYHSTQARRGGRIEKVKHQTVTGAWSAALDIGFSGTRHERPHAAEIARAVWEAMQLQKPAQLSLELPTQGGTHE